MQRNWHTRNSNKESGTGEKLISQVQGSTKSIKCKPAAAPLPILSFIPSKKTSQQFPAEKMKFKVKLKSYILKKREDKGITRRVEIGKTLAGVWIKALKGT